MGWKVSGSNPGWARFSARLDRPWGPPSLLYNGYRVFPEVKYDRGVLLTTHSLLVPWSWKNRAIPLPTLWATTGPVTETLFFSSSSSVVTSILSLCAHIEGMWESRGMVPVILDIDTRLRSVASFTLRPPFYQENNSWYPMNMRLGGPQIPSGKFRIEKKPCVCRESNHDFTAATQQRSRYTNHHSLFPVVIIIIVVSTGTFKIRGMEDNPSGSQIWKYYKGVIVFQWTSWLHRGSIISDTLLSNWCTQFVKSLNY